ncbi:hypothetical protein VTK26DRAFT_1820 [Humicola hyalothermophila]
MVRGQIFSRCFRSGLNWDLSRTLSSKWRVPAPLLTPQHSITAAYYSIQRKFDIASSPVRTAGDQQTSLIAVPVALQEVGVTMGSFGRKEGLIKETK